MSRQLELISTTRDQRKSCSPDHPDHHESIKKKWHPCTTLATRNILYQVCTSQYFWKYRSYLLIAIAYIAFGASPKNKYMSWELLHICLLQGWHSRDVTIIKHLIVIIITFTECLIQAWAINFIIQGKEFHGNNAEKPKWRHEAKAILH